MSTDTVFRSQTTTPAPTTKAQSVPTGKEPSVEGNAQVEVPYRDYEKEHGSPYIVEYFKLGDTWNDPQGGFPKEVETISNHINRLIDSGELANSVTAIKNLLKGLEKVTNVSKEERPLVKVETLSAYIDFLDKTEGIKSNLRRYANA